MDITSMNIIEELISLKEQIKNQVTGEITWQERMELYKQIQAINKRIEEITSTS